MWTGTVAVWLYVSTYVYLHAYWLHAPQAEQRLPLCFGSRKQSLRSSSEWAAAAARAIVACSGCLEFGVNRHSRLKNLEGSSGRSVCGGRSRYPLLQRLGRSRHTVTTGGCSGKSRTSWRPCRAAAEIRLSKVSVSRTPVPVTGPGAQWVHWLQLLDRY